MEETKTMNTPISSSIKLDKDEKGKSIDSTMYRGMIGGRLNQDLSTGLSGFGILRDSHASFSHRFPLIEGFGLDFWEDWRLGFWIWTAFSSSRALQSASAPFSFHFRMPRVSVVSVSLSTNHYSLASSSIWLLDESRLPLRHKASVQLSRLTPPCSVLWRTTSGTNNILLRDE
ncbi:hypothetical protein AAG906_001684 [Vitis piasezkii]